jgi:Ca-activated chloride channel family protein
MTTHGTWASIAAVAAGLWLLWQGPGAVPLAAQDSPFRSGTDIVSLYATVTDRSGRLVPDLTQDDFEVRDNGRRQTLTFFSNDVQPITIVVMLDRSGSMEENFPLVEQATSRFIRELLPADRARIGNFSRQILILPPEFTSDQEKLLQVLHRDMQEVGPSPVWTAVDRSITALLKESGRRVVLLFSDGHNDPRPGQVYSDLKDVIRRSEIDEVMVYAIGLADESSSSSSLAVHNRIGQIQLGRPGRTKLIKPDKGLRQIAERTGGGYFELTWQQDLGAVFSRVADELHHQYAMGFQPQALDGRTHKLEVRLKRPDLSVRGRKSYVAERR